MIAGKRRVRRGLNYTLIRHEVDHLAAQDQGLAALQLALDTRHRMSKSPAMATHLIAGLLCSVGDLDRAVKEYRRGLGNGQCWHPELLLTNSVGITTGPVDPPVSPLIGRPDFDEILELTATALAQARTPHRRRDSPIVYWVSRKSHAPGLRKPRGVLIALHGAADLPELSARVWRPATEAGYVVLAPPSGQLTVSDGLQGWPDRTLGCETIVRIYDELIAAHPKLRGLPVITAGLSQGAELAVRLAIMGEIPNTIGFIAAAPAIRHADEFIDRVPDAAGRDVGGWFIAGEWDYAAASAGRLADWLMSVGVACHMDVAPFTGHAFPIDFSQRLLPALADLTSLRRV
jgi:hypothetical protein